MGILSDLIAKLESGGGQFAGLQPPSMVNPTYGQYGGFASQYGSGASGIDQYAQQVLAANPNATWGEFYSSYVLGTGNPGHLTEPSTLAAEYPQAYNNLVSNGGYPLSTPLSQLVSGAGTPGASGSSGSGWNPLTGFGQPILNATAGATGNVLAGFQQWLTQIGGSVVFVTIGVVLVLGALLIFAANEGSALANSPAGKTVTKIAAMGAVAE